MSKDAWLFAEDWASENVPTEAYDPPATLIRDFVGQLVAAAAENGISEEQLSEDVGDLEEFIAGKFEDATDAEVERLASKEP